MKSLVWIGPRQFSMQHTEVPHPRSGEVVIQVRYSGICGSDLSGYLGTNSLRKPPLVMGHEFSGKVVEVSEDTTSVRLGDLVTVNPIVECGNCDKCLQALPQHCPNKEFIGISIPGSYAEYVRVPAKCCLPVLDPIAGALVEPLACSLRSIRQSNLAIGDSIVVFGAGMIGLFALKVAQLSGAKRRILVDTNEQRLRTGEQFGATHLVHARDADPVRRIMELAGGRVQRVIDAVGAPVVRQQSIQVVDSTGTIVFIGLHHDETTIPGNSVVRSETRIVGSFAYNHDDFARAHTLLNTETIQYDGSWLDIRPLTAAQSAFDEQINGTTRYSKILLEPMPED